MVQPRHHLQKKRHKKVDDYYQKSIDNFKLIIVNPSPKWTDEENRSIATSFGSSYQDPCIETNKKRIMIIVSKSWNENKSIAHPITCAFTPTETVALEIYSIEVE